MSGVARPRTVNRVSRLSRPLRLALSPYNLYYTRSPNFLSAMYRPCKEGRFIRAWQKNSRLLNSEIHKNVREKEKKKMKMTSKAIILFRDFHFQDCFFRFHILENASSWKINLKKLKLDFATNLHIRYTHVVAAQSNPPHPINPYWTGFHIRERHSRWAMLYHRTVPTKRRALQ